MPSDDQPFSDLLPDDDNDEDESVADVFDFDLDENGEGDDTFDFDLDEDNEEDEGEQEGDDTDDEIKDDTQLLVDLGVKEEDTSKNGDSMESSRSRQTDAYTLSVECTLHINTGVRADTDQEAVEKAKEQLEPYEWLARQRIGLNSLGADAEIAEILSPDGEPIEVPHE